MSCGGDAGGGEPTAPTAPTTEVPPAPPQDPAPDDDDDDELPQPQPEPEPEPDPEAGPVAPDPGDREVRPMYGMPAPGPPNKVAPKP